MWDPQETGAGDEERLPKCPAAELGMSLEDRIWEDRKSNTDLVFVTTNFSPPAIIKSLWSLANHNSLAPGEKNHRFSKKKKKYMNEPDIVFASFDTSQVRLPASALCSAFPSVLP